ncbi:hypothetical protein KEM52_006499 [Ascosphaera acerosa]|nr:hypothetical protein KEM52_006499 [Ascosphaera acerosa]
MASNEPDARLLSELQEVEDEYKGGYLTELGYQRRRTLLFTRYGISEELGKQLSAIQTPTQTLDASTPTSVPPHDDDAGPQQSFTGFDDGFSVPPFTAQESGTSAGMVAGAHPAEGATTVLDTPYLQTPTQQPARVHDPSRTYTIDNADDDGLYLAMNLRPTAHVPYQTTQDRRASAQSLTNARPPSAATTQSTSMLAASTPYDDERTATMGTPMPADYAFNPASEPPLAYSPDVGDSSRSSTMLDTHQTCFSDFAGSQATDGPREAYGQGGLRYSFNAAAPDMVPPVASELQMGQVVDHLLPLEPRQVPYDIKDPHDPKKLLTDFDNLPTILRYRSKRHPKQTAFWILDQRGKETAAISWEKLGSRAEKVAQVIRDKSSLFKGGRVALIYRETELIEFAVAFLGCLIAGVVAVPINRIDDLHSLNMVLNSIQAHLALTTESNLKAFQRDLMLAKQNWPRGVEWWKTNEFGSFHPKKNEEVPALNVPDLAYIEFSRSPTGDTRGVVMSHRTIMHQMATIAGIVNSAPPPRGMSTRYETVMSYVDPRQGIGLIFGLLFPVFNGSTMIWFESAAVETPGLFAHLISKHRATVMIADYPGLKTAAYNYQQDPMTTRNFKKNAEPSFAFLKWCFIDTLSVDCEFQELLADRWFKPLRNPRARDIVAPMLCLPEHGGMMIATRDFVGGEERLGCSLTHPMNHRKLEAEAHAAAQEPRPESSKKGSEFGSSLIGGHAVVQKKTVTKTDVWEVLLDREALKTNEIVVLAMGDEAKKLAPTMPHAVRVGAFGYPIPDATLAIVDPENGLLCTPHVIGEVWVDSPSLSGGFWSLPRHTASIFHAQPYRYSEGSVTPVVVEPEFLRTGLLGTIIEGKLYILGMYEDRLRQKVEWLEPGSPMGLPEHRYFFVQHLVYSIMKKVPKIYDCSAFDTFVNEEHLPVVVIESWAASTAPLVSGGPPQQLDLVLLDSLAEKCMEVLYAEHNLRVYCVMITAPNTLPRMPKNGRLEIGNMLCRKGFELGSLPCVHVKFGTTRSVTNIPAGIDPVGGIWSPIASEQRVRSLHTQELQYTGVDYREVVLDDRTSTPLNSMKSITEIIQWRVTRQSDDLCLCFIDGRGKEGKGITWKKFDTKIAAVANYLKNKVKLKPGDHVVLMYTHCEDYVYAVHACLAIGVIAIPMAPISSHRLNEDTPALLHLIQDFKVRALLVNHDSHEVLKQKAVAQHLKQSAHVLKITLPSTYNTTKAPKQSHGTAHLGFVVKKEWLDPQRPAFVWTYWTPDQRRLSVSIGHDTILGMCKIQKETCQMPSTRPVLGCVRSTLGLGFLHTCLMGPYIGSTTYLVSPVDFAANPSSLFQALARYKIKDTYATTQMLDHAMGKIPGKGFQLQELKNMMITYEERPRRDLYQKVRLHFAATGLDRSAINTTYGHILNPMITTRAYICVEPIELWLDPYYLRRGIVSLTSSDVKGALLVQDSGLVPISTQIAIVNPENCRLSRVGEFGEIWVQSEACAKAFYGHVHEFDKQRFKGRIVDGDPSARYVRTGDLGFLHHVTRPIGPGGSLVEMQVLFVLGGIGETIEVNGLHHFPIDIEATIESCHRNITWGGSAVLQAGGLTVAIVEVRRKAYLASMIPVILNAVLNEHQIICDIIAFVGRGDFPRSRLGEKQRGKILASWITRKIRTIAQFSIRDPEMEVQLPPPTAPERSRSATRPGMYGAMPETSSLRSMSLATPADAPLPVAVPPIPTVTPHQADPAASFAQQSQPQTAQRYEEYGDRTPSLDATQLPQGMASAHGEERRFSFMAGPEEFDPQSASTGSMDSGLPHPYQQQGEGGLDSFYADYQDSSFDQSAFTENYHYGNEGSALYAAYAYDDHGDDDDDEGVVGGVKRLQIVNPSISDDEEPSSSAPGQDHMTSNGH